LRLGHFRGAGKESNKKQGIPRRGFLVFGSPGYHMASPGLEARKLSNSGSRIHSPGRGLGHRIAFPSPYGAGYPFCLRAWTHAQGLQECFQEAGTRYGGPPPLRFILPVSGISSNNFPFVTVTIQGWRSPGLAEADPLGRRCYYFRLLSFQRSSQLRTPQGDIGNLDCIRN